MAILEWDKDNQRLFETGVDHVVLYLMNDNGVYEAGEAWNGVTGVTESPEGADANDIYADNIKYLSLISKEDWKGTIKAYTFPISFNKCMGNIYNDAFKAFFGQQKRTKFGISWRSLWGNDTVGDAFAYKLHLAWGLSAAPSEADHATQNDSPEAQEFSWEVSSIPPKTNRKIYMGGAKQTANEKSIQACAHIWIGSHTMHEYTPTGGSLTFGQPNPLMSIFEQKLYGTPASGSTAAVDATLPTLDSVVKYLTTGAW